MPLFLMLFLLIYGGMHVVFARQFLAAFPCGRFGTIGTTLFCVGLMATPFLIRVAENADFDILSRWLARCGFTWMGLLFSFLVGTALAQLLWGIVYSLTQGQGIVSWKESWPQIRFAIGLLWVLFVVVWGVREADDIRLFRVSLHFGKVLKDRSSLRVLQISDVHLGPLVFRSRIDRILEIMASSQPDLVVATGDLVDGSIPDEQRIAELFACIQPPLGKFLVLGNHEWYAGLPFVTKFADAAGFTLVRNEAHEIAPGVTLVGVDDPAGAQMGLCQLPDEKNILPERVENNLVLFLKHRPETDVTLNGRYDLQLSGHSHSGQIAPLGLIIRLLNRWPSGLSEIGSGSWIYHSRGTGTWGPPFRFFTPPEIVCFDMTCGSRKE